MRQFEKKNPQKLKNHLKLQTIIAKTKTIYRKGGYKQQPSFIKGCKTLCYEKDGNKVSKRIELSAMFK